MSNKSIYKNPTYFYTYQIFNTKTHKFYIGVRKSKVDPIKDIGIRYFSSSLDKDFIDDQKLNPQDYEYTVLGIFPSRKEAVAEEISLHEFYNVGQNKRFYNKAKQTSIGFDTSGIELSEEHKRKMSESRKGKFPAKDSKTGELVGRVSVDDPRVLSGELVSVHKGKSFSNEHKRKISEYRRGKTPSEETKRKMSESHKGRTLSGEHKRKIGESHKGKTTSEETKRKMSESSKGKTTSEETKRKMSESSKGRMWIYNSEVKQTKRIKSNEPIPEGWARGRKIF